MKAASARDVECHAKRLAVDNEKEKKAVPEPAREAAMQEDGSASKAQDGGSSGSSSSALASSLEARKRQVESQ